MEITFTKPFYLFFLLSLPVLIMLHYVTLRYVRGRLLQFANFVAMSRISGPHIQPRNSLQLIVRLATLSFIVLAVAGTHFSYLGTAASSDYALAIDVSSSMSAADMKPTRLEAAKSAALEFVSSLPKTTKVGLVTFSGTAFVEQEMTEDKNLLKGKIQAIEISYVGGTDLGEAIVSSSNLLLSGDNARTIVLLTDGRSNIGLGLSEAIDYANRNNIQVFTIGIGTPEGGSPAGLNVSLKLDEETLKRISQLTDAEYIYAANKEEITEAYRSIILAKKKKISVDLTVTLMFLAPLFSFLDWMLMNTRYRRIP